MLAQVHSALDVVILLTLLRGPSEVLSGYGKQEDQDESHPYVRPPPSWRISDLYSNDYKSGYPTEVQYRIHRRRRTQPSEKAEEEFSDLIKRGSFQEYQFQRELNRKQRNWSPREAREEVNAILRDHNQPADDERRGQSNQEANERRRHRESHWDETSRDEDSEGHNSDDDYGEQDGAGHFRRSGDGLANEHSAKRGNPADSKAKHWVPGFQKVQSVWSIIPYNVLATIISIVWITNVIVVAWVIWGRESNPKPPQESYSVISNCKENLLQAGDFCGNNQLLIEKQFEPEFERQGSPTIQAQYGEDRGSELNIPQYHPRSSDSVQVTRRPVRLKPYKYLTQDFHPNEELRAQSPFIRSPSFQTNPNHFQPPAYPAGSSTRQPSPFDQLQSYPGASTAPIEPYFSAPLQTNNLVQRSFVSPQGHLTPAQSAPFQTVQFHTPYQEQCSPFFQEAIQENQYQLQQDNALQTPPLSRPRTPLSNPALYGSRSIKTTNWRFPPTRKQSDPLMMTRIPSNRQLTTLVKNSDQMTQSPSDKELNADGKSDASSGVKKSPRKSKTKKDDDITTSVTEAPSAKSKKEVTVVKADKTVGDESSSELLNVVVRKRKHNRERVNVSTSKSKKAPEPASGEPFTTDNSWQVYDLNKFISIPEQILQVMACPRSGECDHDHSKYRVVGNKIYVRPDLPDRQGKGDDIVSAKEKSNWPLTPVGQSGTQPAATTGIELVRYSNTGEIPFYQDGRQNGGGWTYVKPGVMRGDFAPLGAVQSHQSRKPKVKNVKQVSHGEQKTSRTTPGDKSSEAQTSLSKQTTVSSAYVDGTTWRPRHSRKTKSNKKSINSVVAPPPKGYHVRSDFSSSESAIEVVKPRESSPEQHRWRYKGDRSSTKPAGKPESSRNEHDEGKSGESKHKSSEKSKKLMIIGKLNYLKVHSKQNKPTGDMPSGRVIRTHTKGASTRPCLRSPKSRNLVSDAAVLDRHHNKGRLGMGKEALFSFEHLPQGQKYHVDRRANTSIPEKHSERNENENATTVSSGNKCLPRMSVNRVRAHRRSCRLRQKRCRNGMIRNSFQISPICSLNTNTNASSGQTNACVGEAKSSKMTKEKEDHHPSSFTTNETRDRRHGIGRHSAVGSVSKKSNSSRTLPGREQALVSKAMELGKKSSLSGLRHHHDSSKSAQHEGRSRKKSSETAEALLIKVETKKIVRTRVMKTDGKGMGQNVFHPKSEAEQPSETTKNPASETYQTVDNEHQAKFQDPALQSVANKVAKLNEATGNKNKQSSEKKEELSEVPKEIGGTTGQPIQCPFFVDDNTIVIETGQDTKPEITEMSPIYDAEAVGASQHGRDPSPLTSEEKTISPLIQDGQEVDLKKEASVEGDSEKSSLEKGTLHEIPQKNAQKVDDTLILSNSELNAEEVGASSKKQQDKQQEKSTEESTRKIYEKLAEIKKKRKERKTDVENTESKPKNKSHSVSPQSKRLYHVTEAIDAVLKPRVMSSQQKSPNSKEHTGADILLPKTNSRSIPVIKKKKKKVKVHDSTPMGDSPKPEDESVNIQTKSTVDEIVQTTQMPDSKKKKRKKRSKSTDRHKSERETRDVDKDETDLFEPLVVPSLEPEQNQFVPETWVELYDNRLEAKSETDPKTVTVIDEPSTRPTKKSKFKVSNKEHRELESKWISNKVRLVKKSPPIVPIKYKQRLTLKKASNPYAEVQETPPTKYTKRVKIENDGFEEKDVIYEYIHDDGFICGDAKTVQFSDDVVSWELSPILTMEDQQQSTIEIESGGIHDVQRLHEPDAVVEIANMEDYVEKQSNQMYISEDELPPVQAQETIEQVQEVAEEVPQERWHVNESPIRKIPVWLSKKHLKDKRQKEAKAKKALQLPNRKPARSSKRDEVTIPTLTRAHSLSPQRKKKGVDVKKLKNFLNHMSSDSECRLLVSLRGTPVDFKDIVMGSPVDAPEIIATRKKVAKELKETTALHEAKSEPSVGAKKSRWATTKSSTAEFKVQPKKGNPMALRSADLSHELKNQEQVGDMEQANPTISNSTDLDELVPKTINKPGKHLKRPHGLVKKWKPVKQPKVPSKTSLVLPEVEPETLVQVHEMNQISCGDPERTEPGYLRHSIHRFGMSLLYKIGALKPDPKISRSMSAMDSLNQTQLHTSETE